MIKAIDALKEMNLGNFILYGNPKNEEDFIRMYKKQLGKDENKNAILSSDPNDFGVTWSQVETKIIELQAAEPMRLLRLERDRKIAATDWWVLPDRTPTQAQLDYRQALRDLPSHSPNAALDEQGNLINVTWPTKPEA